MIKKYLLNLTLSAGISALALSASADINFSKKLEAVKNSQESVFNKLDNVYKLVDAEYQSIDGTLSPEMAGLRTAAIAKAGTIAREIFNNSGSSDATDKSKLKEVEDHIQFVRCYSKDLHNYNKLVSALQKDDISAVKAMMGESVMCINLSGVGKVTGIDGTTITLKTVVGKTPATYQWGVEIPVGTHVIFGTKGQNPVHLGQ